MGASGTENFSGTITGVEYLPKLTPGPLAWRTYDEMYRSSAAVRASIKVLTAPILSSTPMVLPPKGGDNDDKAIADFVHAALFADGAMWRPWSFVLRHLLTRLRYGVSASEKVWKYDAESNAWLLHKIAPRVVRSILEWPPDEDGEVMGLRQLTQKGTKLIDVTIPMRKLLVSVNEFEGDNYWGLSVLRSAYMHWFAVMELVRLDLVKHDRYAVGIPVAKISEEANLSRGEKAEIKKNLRGWRSHERAYFYQPVGVEYDVLPKGGGAAAGTDPIPSAEWHTKMISRNVVGDFLGDASEALGSNRTRSLIDMFSSSLVELADEIMSDLSDQVVRELCDLNFDMTGRAYPKAKLGNISDTDVAELVLHISRLGGTGWLTITDEDEQDLREKLGMKALPAEMMGKRDERRSMMDAIRENDPGPKGGKEPEGDNPDADPDDDPDDPDDHDGTAKGRARRSKRVMALTAKRVGLLGRTPTDLERHLLGDVERIPTHLDALTEDLKQKLCAIRLQQLLDLSEAIGKRDARTTTAAFSDLRPDNFTVPAATAVTAAIRAAQLLTFAFARDEVTAQLERQENGRTLLKKRGKKKVQRQIPNTLGTAKATLTSQAKTTAETLNDQWFDRVLEMANAIRRSGVRAGELASQLQARLAPEAEALLTRYAKARVNDAFGLGRSVEAEAQADDIEKAIYSALFDENMCEKCGEADGTETTVGSEEYNRLNPPNVECEGNKGAPGACRCTWIYLMKGATV